MSCVCVCVCVCVPLNKSPMMLVLLRGIAFFLHPMANLSFFSIFIIEYFYTRLMKPDKVETGGGLLTLCNRLLYATV